MATIYTVEENGVKEIEIGDIANLQQMESELDSQYNEWYWDYVDAMVAYTDYATNGGEF